MREATAVIPKIASERSSIGLIQAMLAEQADLTAVERFAQFHEGATAPLNGRFYRSLIPAREPGPGQQYGFEVELDACSGCKACVAACHVLNGLDDDEAWRDVGLIVGRGIGLPVIQHVTSSCHHCLDPACLSACPVDAYEKDPITGIVRHLDDQCFGCQYCTLACPYDAPKYHPAKGIVRKCDMCADRLSEGEAPACVQACPHEAIRIRIVDRDEVAALGVAGTFLTTAPDPSMTLPTTRYLSSKPIGQGSRPADLHRDLPEHVHASLVLMLVLTQASVGGFAADLLLRRINVDQGRISTILTTISAGLCHLGLAASLFHLGRPLYAYRALIGLRHSWLSREVAAFGLFSQLAIGLTAMTFWPFVPVSIVDGLSVATTAAGLMGVFCSAMVYHATRRPFWHIRTSLARFAGSSIALGPSVVMGAASWSGNRAIGMASAVVLILVVGLRLRADLTGLARLNTSDNSFLNRSARLIAGPLRRIWRLRRSLAFVGGILLPMAWITMGPPMVPGVSCCVAGISFVCLLASEMAERSLFFASVVRPKMPGGLAS